MNPIEWAAKLVDGLFEVLWPAKVGRQASAASVAAAGPAEVSADPFPAPSAGHTDNLMPTVLDVVQLLDDTLNRHLDAFTKKAVLREFCDGLKRQIRDPRHIDL